MPIERQGNIDFCKFKRSMIVDALLSTLDTHVEAEAIVAATLVAGKKNFGEAYSISAQIRVDLDPHINEVDCLAVSPILWRPKWKPNRRVWEACLHRVRRIARHVKIQEENVVLLDLVTTPEHTKQLWEYFSTKADAKARMRAEPWQFLLHFPYREELKRELIKRLNVPSLSGRFSEATGCWGTILPIQGETWTSAFGHLVASLGTWFEAVIILTHGGVIQITGASPSPAPIPFETDPFQKEVMVDRTRVVEMMQQMGADVTHYSRLRLFRYYQNESGYSDGDFVVWNPDEPLYTRSGTLMVGWETWLLVVDLRESTITRVSLLDAKLARRRAAIHFRNLRATNERDSG